ncbi:MAG: hypothetical protein AAGI48_04935 [Verrucomicrobiota bacterium]
MTRLRPFLESCWRASWHRARRPVEGILVDRELAAGIAERVLRNMAVDADGDLDSSRFLAATLRETASHSKLTVAQERRKDSDPERHHDPEDQRYARNLDLDELQQQHPERGFDRPEWNHMPEVMKPLAFAQLAKKDIKGPDAEDLFLEVLTELARERGSDHKAPITDLTVFEEIVPMQTRMLQHRSIDLHRRRSSQKNQTNTGPSFDALSDDPDRPMQFADPSSEEGAGLKFEQIYSQCQEALEPDEWQLVFTLYVAQSATVQDLVDDQDFTASLALKPGASASTVRRAINAKIETALEKLRKCLIP